MSIKLSRHLDLNLEKCVENVGGNKFELVLIAAARGRELIKDRAKNATLSNAGVSALLEIQEGKVGREYLKQVGR